MNYLLETSVCDLGWGEGSRVMVRHVTVGFACYLMMFQTFSTGPTLQKFLLWSTWMKRLTLKTPITAAEDGILNNILRLFFSGHRT